MATKRELYSNSVHFFDYELQIIKYSPKKMEEECSAIESSKGAAASTEMMSSVRAAIIQLILKVCSLE